MSKRSMFTTITPLPPTISRETALAFLHDHLEMIDLNPLIIDRRPIPPPDHAPPEERACTWYLITDKIAYLPGGLASGAVSYTAAFHDLPRGLQTHCYAPMGLDIRDKWSIGGTLPGEPAEPVELGIGAPASGLYIREDVDMRCNVIMTSFVKKTIKKAHGTLVEALRSKASAVDASRGSTPSLEHQQRRHQHQHRQHHAHQLSGDWTAPGRGSDHASEVSHQDQRRHQEPVKPAQGAYGALPMPPPRDDLPHPPYQQQPYQTTLHNHYQPQPTAQSHIQELE